MSALNPYILTNPDQRSHKIPLPPRAELKDGVVLPTELHTAIMSYPMLNIAVSTAAQFSNSPICVYGGFKEDMLEAQEYLKPSVSNTFEVDDQDLYDIDAYACMSESEFEDFAKQLKNVATDRQISVSFEKGAEDKADVINLITTNTYGEEVWLTIFRTPSQQASSSLDLDARFALVEEAMANMTYTTDKSYLACESSDIILKDPRGSLTTEAAVERDQLTRNTGLVVLANVASESTTGIPHFNSPSLEIDPDSLFAQLIDLVRKADDGLPYSRELYMALEAFARLPKYVARGFHIDNDTDRLKIVLMLEYIKKFGIPRPADTARALQPEEKFNLTAARSVAEYIGSNRLPNLSRGYVMGAKIKAHHRIADLLTKYPILNYSFPTFIEQVFGNLAYMQLDFPQLLGQEGGLPYVRLSEWESELKLSEPEPRQLIVQYETLWTLSCLARYYEDTNGYGGKIDSINKVLQLIILAKYLTDNLVHAKASTSPKFLSDLVNPKHNPQALSGKIKVSNWPQYPADKKVHGFGMTLDTYRIGTFTQALARLLPTHILRHYTAGLVIQPLLRINREEDWKEGLKRMIYSEAIEASSNPIFKQSGDEVVTLNSSGMYTVFRTQEFQKLFSSLK